MKARYSRPRGLLGFKKELRATVVHTGCLGRSDGLSRSDGLDRSDVWDTGMPAWRCTDMLTCRQAHMAATPQSAVHGKAMCGAPCVPRRAVRCTSTGQYPWAPGREGHSNQGSSQHRIGSRAPSAASFSPPSTCERRATRILLAPAPSRRRPGLAQIPSKRPTEAKVTPRPDRTAEVPGTGGPGCSAPQPFAHYRGAQPTKMAPPKIFRDLRISSLTSADNCRQTIAAREDCCITLPRQLLNEVMESRCKLSLRSCAWSSSC